MSSPMPTPAIEPNATDRILAGMLTENTGRHMLDSGGAYGRHWEQNQAVAGEEPATYFLNRPAAVWDKYSGPILDVFHFLRERIDYAPTVDAAWRRWVELAPRDAYGSWQRHYNSMDTADEFETQLVAKGWATRSPDFAGSWVNTYNAEDALSQVLQYKVLALTDDCPWAKEDCRFERDYALVVLLSIHGGADVRGGYTDLRAFDVWGYDGMCDLLDNARVEAWCEGVEPAQTETLFGADARKVSHFFESDNAGYRWEAFGHDGSQVRDHADFDGTIPTDDDGIPHCPFCGAGMECGARPVG